MEGPTASEKKEYRKSYTTDDLLMLKNNVANGNSNDGVIAKKLDKTFSTRQLERRASVPNISPSDKEIEPLKWKRSQNTTRQFSTMREMSKRDVKSDYGLDISKAALRSVSTKDLPSRGRRNKTFPLQIGNQRNSLRRETNVEVLQKEKELKIESIPFETRQERTPSLGFQWKNEYTPRESQETEIKNPSGRTPPIPRNCANLDKTMPLTVKNDINKILKQGFLVKRGHVRKNWKVRWFTLTRLALSYSTSPETTNTPLGQINLCNAPEEMYVIKTFDPDQASKPPKQHRQTVFAVIDKKTLKDYYLDAKTSRDVLEWMQAINQVLADNISNISFRYYVQ